MLSDTKINGYVTDILGIILSDDPNTPNALYRHDPNVEMVAWLLDEFCTAYIRQEIVVRDFPHGLKKVTIDRLQQRIKDVEDLVVEWKSEISNDSTSTPEATYLARRLSGYLSARNASIRPRLIAGLGIHQASDMQVDYHPREFRQITIDDLSEVQRN